MAEVMEASTATPSSSELLASGRRHLAVRDYSMAVETLAKACEALAKEHGDMADQCAEAYLWYGKALLGLSRLESGVLGDGIAGADQEEEEDDEEEGENGDTANGEAENGEAEVAEESKENGATEDAKSKENEEDKSESAVEASSSKADDAAGPSSSTADAEPGPSNGEANDESVVENDDDVENLQLAWEMLDLARNILSRREGASAGSDGRALLADVLLTLGEVALESETYDKAVQDMLSCLEIQKELYRSDDRRIAETHYQIGLANSLASNFEDAITHYKNAVNILESRIKMLENPTTATEDASVKKYATSDPSYSVEGEIKELKELLPEIQEKIQDMMDYKAETVKRVREALFETNGSASGSSTGAGAANGATSSAAKPVSDISHLIKRKRKASESEDPAPAKKPAVDP